MDHEVKEICVPDPAAPSGYLTKYRVMRGADRVATCHRRSLAERVVEALDRVLVARKLYRVEIVHPEDGELDRVFWVTAVSPSEALGLVALAADGDGPPDPPDAPRVVGAGGIDLTGGYEIASLSEEQAGTYQDEPSGPLLSVWEAHMDAKRSEVIACSETP